MKFTIFVLLVTVCLTQGRNLRLIKRQSTFDYPDYGTDENALNQFGAQNGQDQFANQGALNQLGNQGGFNQFNNQGSQGLTGQQNGQFPGQNIPVSSQPTTAAPAAVPTTPPSLQIRQCIANCRTITSEWNPVCGSNGVRYGNPSALRCAQNCGTNVVLATPSRCA